MRFTSSVRFLSMVAAVLSFVFAANLAQAGEVQFYRSIAGKWTGPGEIVAGKYKGTKFTCNFNGITPNSRTGMSIDGYCRVGVFNQPMKASFERRGNGYSGQFLDGEAGEGMDVVGGRFLGSKVVVDIKRKDLRGVMVTRLTSDDKLNITISVRVDKRLIPVIGMTLDRSASTDGMVTSSVTD
ncbi:MAG: hypothetical protein WBO55_02210 [Rhizobiaceae bacterium]